MAGRTENSDTLGYRGARTFRDFLWWRMTARPVPWPKRVALAPQPPPPAPRGAEIVATWLGHASFLIQTTRGNILFDPVFSERVSPFAWIGPRRVHPVPIALDALPRIDAVCVSHDHYDHFDAPTLRRLAQATDAVFVAPLRHGDLLRAVGARRIVELDWWKTHGVADGLDVTLTPAKHWTNRLGTPRNFRLWGGFWVELRISDFELRNGAAPASVEKSVGENVADRSTRSSASAPASQIRDPRSEIRNQTRHVWFVGDSGYDQPLFAEIRERLGGPDVALVPIGAYEPRWFMAPMHMNPAEAVKLHQDVGARLSLAMHWGTFRLTDEGRDEPVRALESARNQHGVATNEFRVIQPGESVVA